MDEANDTAPERSMRLRIGINAGDIMVREGDIFGDGVNVAARLEGLVKGGEICVSRGVRDSLRHRGGIIFEDLGEQLVKNIAHPIRAFRLCIGEGSSAPEGLSLEESSGSPELASAPAEISELSADNEVALELALWDSVKDSSPAELESYLEQYPDGTFASLARTRLDTAALSPAPVTPEDAAADALDLAFWNSVKDSNRREELQAYLEQHPDGHFAGLARARLSSF
jgi:adenylate cyclase